MLVAVNLKQITKLEEALKAELAADLEAIRRVKKLLKEREGKPSVKRLEVALDAQTAQTRAPISTAVPIVANGTIESKVLAVIGSMEGPFGLADLLKKLNDTFPSEDFSRNTVSSILFRKRNTAFRTVREGRGRKKALYEKM